jgi:hypothetical protein
MPPCLVQLKNIGENVRSLRVKSQPLEHAVARTGRDLHWPDRRVRRHHLKWGRFKGPSFVLHGYWTCTDVGLSASYRKSSATATIKPDYGIFFKPAHNKVDVEGRKHDSILYLE